MNMTWYQLHLWGVEALSVATSFWMFHLLGLKDRRGWLLYVVSGALLIYLMIIKESWVTVVNQSLMLVFGLKNFYAFGRPDRQRWHNIDWLSVPCYFGSLLLVRELSWSALSEVLLWGIIIMKTIALGKGQLNGWKWQIAQQTASIIFGLYRDIYIYVAKSIVQLVQAFWGYWQWKRSEAAGESAQKQP